MRPEQPFSSKTEDAWGSGSTDGGKKDGKV